MSRTSWKDIPPVPTNQEFLDIVLSRTQRRLPTQIRAGFKISRIRGFYTRKVKFTAETVRHQATLFHRTTGAMASTSSRCRAASHGQQRIHLNEICKSNANPMPHTVLREVFPDHLNFPAPAGHSPFPPRSSKHPLRCRPLPRRSGSDLDREALD